MSVPPGERLQRGRDVGEVMLNPSKLVSCVWAVWASGDVPSGWAVLTLSCQLSMTGLAWAGLGQVVLCCVGLCCTEPCCAAGGSCALLYCTRLCHAMPDCATLCCAILGCVVPTRAVLVGASKFFKSEVLSQAA